jgi:excisionase family DNA binding protein
MNEDFSTTGPFFDTAHTVKELAGYMGVTERFIYSQIEKKKLHPTRVSINLVRLHPEDIRNWLRGLDVPKRIVNPKAAGSKKSRAKKSAPLRLLAGNSAPSVTEEAK